MTQHAGTGSEHMSETVEGGDSGCIMFERSPRPCSFSHPMDVAIPNVEHLPQPKSLSVLKTQRGLSFSLLRQPAKPVTSLYTLQAFGARSKGYGTAVGQQNSRKHCTG